MSYHHQGMTPEEMQAEYRRGLAGQCPQRTVYPAKPSPREALLRVVAAMAKSRSDCAAASEGYPDTSSEYLAKACTWDDAITLIRSMAGHLMENP